LENFLVSERLVASQEELNSMELVSYKKSETATGGLAQSMQEGEEEAELMPSKANLSYCSSLTRCVLSDSNNFHQLICWFQFHIYVHSSFRIHLRFRCISCFCCCQVRVTARNKCVYCTTVWSPDDLQKALLVGKEWKNRHCLFKLFLTYVSKSFPSKI
jgi:hypothetical protein